MKIEPNKFYCTRDGRRVGPIKRGKNSERYPGDFWIVTDMWGPTWWEDGHVYSGRESDGDIVAEWAGDDGRLPTRVVSRIEIVSGQYGRMACYSPSERKDVVSVALLREGHDVHIDTPHFYLNHEELRAVARSLNALAEALEQDT